MSLDATPGSATANSYVTVAQASVYLAERLHAELWFVPDDSAEPVTMPSWSPSNPLTWPNDFGIRETALIWATHRLDEQVAWYGQPRTLTQALAWPMSGQVDRYGRPEPQDTIPLTIQRGTAYYALELLQDRQAQLAAVSASQPIHALKIGDTTVTYQTAATATSRTTTTAVAQRAATKLSVELRQLLRPYGTLTGSIMVPLRRT
jgi:hypothetical protein